jgi:hypothetical protein
LGAPRAAHAQTPAHPTVLVRVVDTADHAMPDAELLVVDSGSARQLHQQTVPASGALTLTDLIVGRTYILRARKVGYRPLVTVFTLARDSMEIVMELGRPNVLADVTVKGRAQPSTSIDERELGKHPIENMRLDKALSNYRRMMLSDRNFLIGDPDKCPHDTILNIYVNGVRWPMAPRPDNDPNMDSSEIKRTLARDKAHRDFDVTKGPGDTIALFPKRQLAYYPLYEIFASDVAYVRYFDCWEKELPKYRNSIVILLKPGVEFPSKHYGEAQKKPTRDGSS